MAKAKKTEEVWWYVDKKGRKIGWMWPEDFEAQLLASYLRVDGMEVFAYDFGVDNELIEAWISGAEPIPKWAARIVMTLKDRIIFAARLEPILHPRWLPDTFDSSNSKNRPKGYTDDAAKMFRDRSPSDAGPLAPKHISNSFETKHPANLTNYVDYRIQDNPHYHR